MRIDLPGCNFHECRYYADGNCIDTNTHTNCMYKFYQAAYEKLLTDGNFTDDKFPQVPGYYILLVYNNHSSKLEKISGKWTGNKFEGVDDKLYTIVAWE